MADPKRVASAWLRLAKDAKFKKLEAIEVKGLSPRALIFLAGRFNNLRAFKVDPDDKDWIALLDAGFVTPPTKGAGREWAPRISNEGREALFRYARKTVAALPGKVLARMQDVEQDKRGKLKLLQANKLRRLGIADQNSLTNYGRFVARHSRQGLL